jgi:hypothetical protein
MYAWIGNMHIPVWSAHIMIMFLTIIVEIVWTIVLKSRFVEWILIKLFELGWNTWTESLQKLHHYRLSDRSWTEAGPCDLADNRVVFFYCFRYPEFVLEHLHVLPINENDRIRKASCLLYFSYLQQCYRLNYQSLRAKGKLECNVFIYFHYGIVNRVRAEQL